MKRLIPLLLCALLGLSACSGSGDGGKYFQFGVANPRGKTIPEQQRKPAADIEGGLLTGKKYALSEDAGKVVVVNYWASWCGPCQVETPQFNVMYEQLKAHNITFLGIDFKDARSSAKLFIHDNKIKYPILYDEPGQTALQLGNLPTSGLPITLVIDKKQRVAAVYIGAQTPKDLQPVLTRLAAES